MNLKEKELFLQLCRYRNADKKRIKTLIARGYATPEVLGMLLANRVGGIAYHTLSEANSLDQLDREFRNTLRNTAQFNEKKNDDFYGCLKYLSTELDACGVTYALLKGAFLCGWYPKGCRTSNDIDVLITPEDVGKVATRLKLAGFRQGYLKNEVFIPASRQEIIESKMTRGETVPFIKEVKLPFVKYLEVDLNFSMDYKNSNDTILKEMLNRTVVETFENIKIRTLSPLDFILHLGAHLYKEATTMPWIRMKRDMTFYKYCDLYALLYDYDEDRMDELLRRADDLKLKTELFYGFRSVLSFFNLPCLKLVDDSFGENDPLHQVISPKDKKVFRYVEQDLVNRFFAKDRTKLLEEVP